MRLEHALPSRLAHFPSDPEVGFEVPLVVRLEGTNVDAARKILEAAQSEIPTMQTATDLADAARQICQSVG